MRRIGWLAFLGAALFLVPGCGKAKSDKSSRDPKKTAKAAAEHEQFRHDTADDEFQKGRAAAGRDDKTKAVGHFERAARLNPAEPSYPLAAGQMYLDLGDLGKAEIMLQNAFRALQAIQPEHPMDVIPYRIMLAEIYAAVGDLHQKSDRIPDAINAYQSAVEANPGMARAQFELGSLFLKRGRFLAAEGRFLEALKADPSMLRAHTGLIITYHEGGDSVRAWKEIQELEKKGFAVNANLRESVLAGMKNPRNPG